jgi:hypothetical protein
VKLHLLLDHDGYLPVFAHLTEGKSHELLMAHKLRLPKGRIVAMDRGYIDYRLFNRWTTKGVYFVTRLKENANFWDFEDRDNPWVAPALLFRRVEVWSSADAVALA